LYYLFLVILTYQKKKFGSYFLWDICMLTSDYKT
jgi:hypothetical protein